MCLVAFSLWTLALVLLGVVPYRAGQVLLKKARANSFTPAVPHGPDWYQRLMRAHANAAENLPVFAALVVVGELSGVSARVPALGTLAVVVCVARVGQTVAHLSSGRSVVVNVRFAFFSTQLLAMVAMGVLLLLR